MCQIHGLFVHLYFLLKQTGQKQYKQIPVTIILFEIRLYHILTAVFSLKYIRPNGNHK